MATASKPWGNVAAPPPRHAFHVEWVIDPFTGEPAIGMVRHPPVRYRPTPAQRAALRPRSNALWQDIGRRYLRELAAALDLKAGDAGWLHPDVWKALQARTPHRRPPGFGWLDILWTRPVSTRRTTLPANASPLASFWVDMPAQHPRSGVLVLLAGSACQPHRLQLGSDIGLRIAIDVRADELLIRGVTLSGLSGPRAVQAIPAWAQSEDALFAQVEAMRQPIERALDCGQARINNLELTREGPASGRLRATGHALRWRQTGAPPGAGPNRAAVHDFCVDLEAHPAAPGWRVVQVGRNDFIGSAARATWFEQPVFVADPASLGPARSLRDRRPTRSEAALDQHRRRVRFDLQQGAALQFIDGDPVFETRGARPRPGGAPTVDVNPRGVVRIARQGPPDPGQGPVLMSDTAGSVETHARASELFARLMAYGMAPGFYFRFARLPLVQRARPAMRWAPQGELPNAEVRPFVGDATADAGKAGPKDRIQLLVKYGSADPLHRRRLPSPADKRRSSAQFLSVASDPRWAWHEFGHVLNFASTGELEFPFAHSAGDALAAIAGDPLSLLAADDPEAPVRFATFPWIQVPGRNHGRSAAGGYCWCGRRNRLRLAFDGPLERYRHGYYQEQLLSSSLFRLYRCLGGDTRQAHGGDDLADALMRLEASDYCIYLVMRAISMLGPDSIAPARSADQFVSALIDADASTGDWQVEAAWPFDLDQLIASGRFSRSAGAAGDRSMRRRGGRVHKVIRWAFERQGLYATDDPREIADRPGDPPPVDVYIADRRQAGPDAHEGGYSPVPLRVDADADDGAALAMHWLADPAACERDSRHLKVRIANRGHESAEGITVRAWWCARGPAFAWRALPLSGASVETLAGRAAAWASLQLDEALAPEGWLLIAADAPADPANLDAEPPTEPAALLELVAHDNNLALFRL
ncbi:hypothetical protein [Aquabacterium humicola]|uniref:hypothetical protein n=1 Tax=Aquabacterium humicola TaxID=3237377 RepID=UPI0025438EFA|nr:hypothetical protein [Rubrivivax pictus]